MIPVQLNKPEFRFVKIGNKNKACFETGWQDNNNYSFEEINEWVSKGNNYGIIGGYGNLVIVDFDNEKVQEEVETRFPRTFTVKAGGGLKHFYFIVECPEKSFKILDSDKNTLVDVQATGKYVVAPESTHPNGNKYKVVDDSPIAKIDYNLIKGYLYKYRDTKDVEFNNTSKDPLIEEIINRVSIKDVLGWEGINNIKNPTECPFHSSKGGKCFSYKDKVAHCFHCDGSWNVVSLIKDIKNYDFKQSINYLAKRTGLKEVFENRLKDKRVNQIKDKTNKIDLSYKDVAEKALGCLAYKDEEGMSEVITQYIKNNYYIKSTRDDLKSEIWFYEEGIYIPNGESLIKEITRKILGKDYTMNRVNKVIAKVEADTQIDLDLFFNTNNKEELPVKNGILNVVTKTIEEFNPNKIFFNKLPVRYDPSATCSNITKFFSDVLKDESDVLVIEELFGYCLYKENFLERSFMFIGDGRNGKGKTIELLKNLLGVKNICSVPLAEMHSKSTSVAELHGKLANLSGDLSKTALKETGLFKEITGRDPIGAKRKYLRDLVFVNYSKQVFACNTLPKVYDTSKGFWSRWMLLEFPYEFMNKKDYEELDPTLRINKKIRDVNIIEKISTEEEMSGLLNKSLEGLKRLIDNKDFSKTKGTSEIKDLWVRRSDSFMAFMMDNIIEEYGSTLPKKVLRKRYSDYCKKHRVLGCSDKSILINLQEYFGTSDDRKVVPGLGDSPIPVWENITIKGLERNFNKIMAEEEWVK